MRKPTENCVLGTCTLTTIVYNVSAMSRSVGFLLEVKGDIYRSCFQSL